MIKKFFIILLFSVLFSCSLQKNNTEFIELKHKNVHVIGGDEVRIRLIPTKSKKALVKIFNKGEYYDNKRVSYEKYLQIRDMILTIEQKELELPKKQNYMGGIFDGGSNSIYFKSDTIEKKYYTYGISEKYHGRFYEVAKLILKSAKMNISDID